MLAHPGRSRRPSARSPRKAGTDGALAAGSGCTGAAAGLLRAVTAWAQPGRPRNSLQREPSGSGRTRGPGTSVQKTASRGQQSGAGAPRKQPPHGVLIAPEQSQLKIGCREQGGESRADVTYCVSEYRWHQHNQGVHLGKHTRDPLSTQVGDPRDPPWTPPPPRPGNTNTRCREQTASWPGQAQGSVLVRRAGAAPGAGAGGFSREPGVT